jgi:5-methylcytosine-specific restriction endonuclease McrA
MSLRRYTALKPSRGTVIPPHVRAYVHARDNGCVLRSLLPHTCWGGLELDHVRASGGLGMKSPSTADNLVTVCSAAHRYKTEHGREVRPLLEEYLRKVER